MNDPKDFHTSEECQAAYAQGVEDSQNAGILDEFSHSLGNLICGLDSVADSYSAGFEHGITNS